MSTTNENHSFTIGPEPIFVHWSLPEDIPEYEPLEVTDNKNGTISVKMTRNVGRMFLHNPECFIKVKF